MFAAEETVSLVLDERDLMVDGHFQQGGNLAGTKLTGAKVVLGQIGDLEAAGRGVFGLNKGIMVGGALVLSAAVERDEVEGEDDEDDNFGDQGDERAIVGGRSGDNEGVGGELKVKGEILAGGEVGGGEAEAVT